jgi:hypothetical protein
MYDSDIECRLVEVFGKCLKTKKIKANEFMKLSTRLLAYLPEDEVEAYLCFFFGPEVMTMFMKTMTLEELEKSV